MSSANFLLSLAKGALLLHLASRLEDGRQAVEVERRRVKAAKSEHARAEAADRLTAMERTVERLEIGRDVLREELELATGAIVEVVAGKRGKPKETP